MEESRHKCRASQVALVVNNLAANAGDVGSIPGVGRSPGEGHGNTLQYPCLENPMDRGSWRATVWATVHRVTKSPIKLKRTCMRQVEKPESVAFAGFCAINIPNRADF